LSIRAKDDAELADAVDQYKRSGSVGGTTLGDLLKEQLESKE